MKLTYTSIKRYLLDAPAPGTWNLPTHLALPHQAPKSRSLECTAFVAPRADGGNGWSHMSKRCR